MAERAIVKVSKHGNSLMVALPRPLLHRLGWTIGTRVVLEQREGCVLIAEIERAFGDRVFDRVADGRPAIVEGKA